MAALTGSANTNDIMYNVAENGKVVNSSRETNNIPSSPSKSQSNSYPNHRTSLPSQMPSHADISVWSILKQCIGKDLSKITMPIVFNEPLTFLQRLAEYMEYSYLLDRAVAAENPIDRMEFVAAFAVSGCATNWKRLGKPFNPLLGETFELDMPERGYSMVCEQVCNHPPISAFHVDSKTYKFHGSIQPTSKFWGKALDITPLGLINLELLSYDEIYTWSNPNCTIHNLIMGKLWIEHSGTLEITNHLNKYNCILNFRPAGYFGKEVNRVDGFIYDQRKTKVRALYGHWNFALYSTPSLSKRRRSRLSKIAFSIQNTLAQNSENMSLHPENPQTKDVRFVLDLPQSKILWRYIPKPSNSQQMFNFSLFSMILNEIPADPSTFPPTDSRFRPDLRAYENGRIDLASQLNEKLNIKAMAGEKLVKSLSRDKLTYLIKTSPHCRHWNCNKPLKSLDELRSCDIVKTPLWFVACKNEWKFNNKYWKRDHSHCPRIFDLPQ